MASKNSSLVLGILGAGEADVETTAALLGDVLDAAEANDQDVSFVLPVTKEHFTDSIKDLADWFIESDIPFEAVTNEEGAKAKALKDYLQAATKEHSVKGIPLKMVNLLAAADEGRLLLLWDDEDDECYDAMNKAVAKDVKIFDLSNALDKIVPDDGEPDAEEEASEDGDEPDAEPSADYQPYTRAELEAMEDLDDLKSIASDWDIEVAPRSRAKTYIDAILKAQEAYEAENAGGSDDDSGRKAQSETKAETVVVNQSIDLTETNEKLDAIVEALGEILAEMQKVSVEVKVEPEKADEPEDEEPPATRMPPRRTPPRRS